ncbi:MAG: addiction module toxin, HicA family [Dehalococcoidia bacterium]|nr:addiction module toxin, HicA family [Dehalococcoidia bacterium]
MQISGRDLIRLLEGDGWERVRTATHGVWLRKRVSNRTLHTTVKDTRKIIPATTLGQILSLKQTGLGHAGLQRLLDGES